MQDKDPTPEEFRCKRTDGRQWRCKRRAMDGMTLCDIHYLQGKHRQNKQRVPDSLKLERNVTRKREIDNGGSAVRVPKVKKMLVVESSEKKRRTGVSEALDDALKKMKLKSGDLQLELIRVFLKRQVEKKKEKEKELKESEIGDERRQLPYGVMAISQSNSSLQKVNENHGLDVKLGADDSNNSFLQRHFRSKNIEPLPISTMQVVPFAENMKKKKIKKCHWCRESKRSSLVRCLSCRKRFFCVKCIRERHFEKQEVKLKCPACLGTCSCKLCMKLQYKTNHKECWKGRKLDKKQLLYYLMHMLLPVLKKINQNQDIELETESKVTGKEQSEIEIPQIKFRTSPCCNKCKSSILDYHRVCKNCSYSLCLGCCRELSQHSLYGNCRLRSCKKRRICSPGDQPPLNQNISRKDSCGLPCPSIISLQNWGTSEDGSIPCPPKESGGCGDGLLDLRCVFPFNWTKDLEVRADDILCSYNLPETADESACCSQCNNSFTNGDVIKPQGEFPRRIGFDGSYLYCPTVKDLQQETLVHFQSHWGKGHPVIVRNVLRRNTGLCWDPIIMFCSYMENKCSKFRNEDGVKATNNLDWCEVEIDRKRIFMGSLEKRTHASVHQKVLKFKAWLSSCLFEKQFPVHYYEILNSLPLPEYINPVSGLLNVSAKLPKELPKPELGPCVYLSYGGPEELGQADYISKLCYESHDKVSILTYATDAPISPEQFKKIETLMKKYKTRDQQSFSNSSDCKGKSSLQSDDTGESSLQDIGENLHLPNGIENLPFHSSAAFKGQTLPVENGNLTDDSESDDEESILFCGSIEQSEDSDSQGEDMESSCSSEDKHGTDSCGAQWDIFSREDVPKLLEYLRKHSNELNATCNYSKHGHPILDQSIFLDAYHKLRLKEEFDIQPWTFEQYTGEAIFVPAGCPYQIRKIKSCVSVVLDFISPENASQCIQLNDEIHLLPTRHKARRKVMEVEKMALQGISSAIEDIQHCLMPVKQD